MKKTRATTGNKEIDVQPEKKYLPMSFK